MKTRFLIVLGMALSIGSYCYAQKKPVTIQESQVPLKEVLNRIEKQTNYLFVYDEQKIDTQRKVSVNVKNKKVSDVLADLFKGEAAVTISMEGEHIILTPKVTQTRQDNNTTRKITGNVIDKNGEPMIGVSILVKGSTNGTVTDLDGKFSIDNVNSENTLVVSYIGYTKQEVNIKNRNDITIVMKDDTQTLDEVVVVGYGTMKKRDLTGAITSVSADKIKERSYSNVMQSLSGQMPGVQISQSSGAPGFAPSIKIRGASSINSGTTPLYVIDGIPLEDATNSNGTNAASDLSYNQNPLNSINPNDIESVEVLKDASSAAIYGSRGANGVVIITTKQGQAGKTNVNINYELGMSKVARRIHMMNAPEFMDYSIAARNNTWVTNYGGSPSDPNSMRPITLWIPEEFSDPTWKERIGEGTDWQDVLFRTGVSHNVQASVSGGNEKTQFMTSAGYLAQEGVVDNDYYNRMNFRVNLRHKLSDRINIGVNMAFSRSDNQSFGTAGKSDVVSMALQSDPIFPVYNECGTLGFRDPSSIWYVFNKYQYQLWHPYAFTRESTNKKTINNFQAIAFAEFKIIDGLNFKTSLSGITDDQQYSDYRNQGQNYGWPSQRDAEAQSRAQNMYNWVWENTFNYNQTFGNHSISGVVGYTAQKQQTKNSQMIAGSFSNDLIHTLNAGVVSSGSTSINEWTLISYLARANYSYKQKYLFSAAIRADGCSRFGKNNRWGYFPSMSVGWRLSEEPFMKSVTGNWLDNLKLRVSYGETGNNQIPNYGAIGLMDYSNYIVNGGIAQGMYPSNYVDENLKWEKTGQINVGLDISIFNQRINLSLDYYYSKTKDLLLNVPIPILTGYKTTLTNIGKLQNKGLELNLTTHNLTGEFTWTTDFNISGNRNKVLKLGTNNAPIITNTNSCMLRTEVGKPISNYYGYILDGVIMSEAELSQYPVYPGSEAGDPRVRDVDKSGSIDGEDRTDIGNYQPDFTWGMTNTFTYKGFDFSFMLTGVEGNEVFNQQARFTKIGRVDRNCYQIVSNFWRSEENPGDGKIFKPRTEENTVQNQCSSYWIEDGSFVRIKNMRIGYTFPKKWISRLGLSSAKIYVNVENLYVFSDYINYDPEASSFQTGALQGLDYASYPNPRTWTMGINLNF